VGFTSETILFYILLGDYFMKIREVIDTFLDQAILAERTKIIYRPFLEGIFNITKNIDIEDLKVSHVSKYKQQLYSSKKSIDQVHKAIVTIRSLLKWTTQNYDFNVLDYNKLAVPKVNYKSYGYFTKEEIQKLRNVIKNQRYTHQANILRDQIIFETVYSTGLRSNELRNLKISDLDLNKSEADVIGKGNKPAKVYFTTTTKKIISEYLKTRDDDCPYLVITRDYVNKRPTTQVCYEFIRCRFNRWGKMAGLKKCHPHMLRKSFCTEIWKQSGDILQTSRLARHADVSVTQRYILTDQATDKEAHATYLGNNRRFVFEEKREGRIVIKAEVFCGEGINPKRAKLAMREAVDKLLS